MEIRLKITAIIITILVSGSILVLLQAGNATAETPLFDKDPYHEASDGCMVYYSFDHPDWSSSQIRDDSGNNRHGAMVGNVHFDEDTKSSFGSSMYFDGNGDQAYAPSIQPSEFTLSCWIKPENAQQNWDNIISKYYFKDMGSYKVYYSWALGIHANGRIWATVNENNVKYTITTSAKVCFDRWTHLSTTYDGDNLKILINGVEEGSKPTPSSGGICYDSSKVVRIGAYNNNLFFKGNIDEVKIINRGLTNEEAKLLYQYNDLALYYSFDNYQWTDGIYTVRDESGNGNSGYLAHDASFTSNTLYGRCIDLDGDEDAIVGESFVCSNWNEMTIEASIFIRDIVGTNVISSKFGQFNIEHQDSDLYFTIDGVGTVNAPSILQENEWIQVTCLWDGVSQYIYINGNLEASQTGTGSISPDYDSSKIIIGNSLDSNGNPNNFEFKGYIDEIKIHRKSLNPDDGMGQCMLKVGFEEGNGGYVTDRSSNNFIGDKSGGTWREDGKFSSRCLEFDGVNDYVSFDHSSEFIFTEGFSVEAWIKPNGNQNDKMIVSKYKTTAGDSYWWLKVRSDNKFGFGVKFSNGVTKEIWSGTKLSSLCDNEWHHIKGARIGQSIHIYIDGKWENCYSSGGGGTVGNTNAPVCIGSYNTGSGKFFKGKLDDVRINNFAKKVGEGRERLIYQFEEDSSVIDETNWNNDGIYLSSTNTEGSYLSGKYGESLILENELESVVVPANSKLNFNSHLTIEAWINWDGSSNLDTIIANRGHYWVFINSDDKLCYSTGAPPWEHTVISKSSIPTGKWTHIAVVRNGDGTDPNSVRIFINGMLDQMGSAGEPTSAHNDVYIGKYAYGTGQTSYGEEHGFLGRIDNLILTDYAKTFREDFDGDSMSEIYEIVHSDGSDQFNSIQYNGRYGMLCAPVREDDEIQYKYDITQMRNFLISNGWNDLDLIFLTCESSDGRTGLSDTTAGLYNGDWIDGEAYYVNLDSALSGFQNGGSFNLLQDNGWLEINHLPKSTQRDLFFFEYRNHGVGYNTDDSQNKFSDYGRPDSNNDENTGGHSESPAYDEGLCTYDSGYGVDENDFWYDDELDYQFDQISCKYMILEFDCCYSGGFIHDTSDTNRIVITSETEYSYSDRYAYLFYGRIRGEIESKYSDSGTISTESHNENLNADGITAVTGPNRNSIRSDPTYNNALISVQEAHWFADAVCYDKYSSFSPIQQPLMSEGENIPEQMYF